jgi:hypothetical protein
MSEHICKPSCHNPCLLDDEKKVSMSEQATDLQAIAEQLVDKWAIDYAITLPKLVERAMRLRDEAWREVVRRDLPESDVDGIMSELMKAEAKK